MFLKLFFSAIFGVVQGLAEFLPISSSGHLIILHRIFNLNIDSLIFDVALHLGALIALLLFFRHKFYIFFQEVSNFKKNQDKKNLKLLFLIFIATIPAAIAGFFFEDIIESYFRNIIVVSIALIIGGALLMLADKYSAKEKEIYSVGICDAFIIGVAQVFALIPGVSRSAITIIAGLGLKQKRKAAAEFSFLMAIPIIFGAALKKTFDINLNLLSLEDKWVFLVGILSSFVVSYLVIKYFIKFLEKHSLKVFGWYRIVLGILILSLLVS